MYKNFHSGFPGRSIAQKLFFLACLACSIEAGAATVSSGSLTLNLDRDALIAGVQIDNYPDAPTDTFPACCRPSIYVEELFDSVTTYDGVSQRYHSLNQLLVLNTPDIYDSVSDEISAIGLQFPVNGTSIPDGPPGFPKRLTNKNTTFSFDPADLTGTAVGRIGFDGVIRYRVDVDPPQNRVLMGDFSLVYDAANEALSPGQSGWTLMNNIGFTIIGFDLFDVTTQLTGDTLTLSGVLGLGEGFDHLQSIRDTRVGTFTFQTTVVPVPAAVWLLASGLAGFGAVGARRPQRLV